MGLLKLTAARLKAIDQQPFLAVALYALSPVDAPGLGTFAVDERWRLFIDPDALQAWTTDEVAGVLLHEVGHVVRAHADRARDLGVDATTARRWNVAADAEINDDLDRDRVKLPGTYVTPRSLRLPAGKAAEFYYDRIGDREVRDAPDCGAGCHGIDPEDTARRTGIVGLEPHESALVRRRVAEAVVEWSRGRRAGLGAGGWERWAVSLLHPVVDWRTLLRARLRAGLALGAGRVDYSLGRPSRRSSAEVVLPSLRQPVPSVAALIDTSASVDDARLARAWTEVQGCLRAIGVRRDLLHVYAVDTAVTRIRGRGAGVHLRGGGGTDLREGFRAVLANRPRAGLIVVLTDGETPWPDTPPVARVVVVLLGHEPPSAPPAWCDVVRVPVDDEQVSTARTPLAR